MSNSRPDGAHAILLHETQYSDTSTPFTDHLVPPLTLEKELGAPPFSEVRFTEVLPGVNRLNGAVVVQGQPADRPIASKENVRDYFVTADLQEILRGALSDILHRDDRPKPNKLLEALGRELLAKCGAEQTKPTPQPITLELGGPSASTEAKQLRERLADLENYQ